MKKVFESQSGWFAADTSDVEKSLPKNTMRFYFAKVEAFDIPLRGANALQLQAQMTLFISEAEKDKRIARAMLKLQHALEINRAEIKKAVRPE